MGVCLLASNSVASRPSLPSHRCTHPKIPFSTLDPFCSSASLFLKNLPKLELLVPSNGFAHLKPILFAIDLLQLRLATFFHVPARLMLSSLVLDASTSKALLLFQSHSCVDAPLLFIGCGHMTSFVVVLDLACADISPLSRHLLCLKSMLLTVGTSRIKSSMFLLDPATMSLLLLVKLTTLLSTSLLCIASLRCRASSLALNLVNIGTPTFLKTSSRSDVFVIILGIVHTETPLSVRSSTCTSSCFPVSDVAQFGFPLLASNFFHSDLSALFHGLSKLRSAPFALKAAYIGFSMTTHSLSRSRSCTLMASVS